MQKRTFKEVKDELFNHFKQGLIVPILGAGLTYNEKSQNGKVPSGDDLRKHMMEEIEKVQGYSEKLDKLSFPQLCTVYESYVNPKLRLKYFKDSFTNVKLPEYKVDFLNLPWKYIYTMNIDDAIEYNSSFTEVINPGRPVNEQVFDDYKCTIKLHGDINDIKKYKDSFKVFTSKEYVSSLTKNSSLLNKLEHDFANLNILFVGCSLSDELDLLSLGVISSEGEDKKLRKIYFCCAQEPDFIEMSNLENYGVTDIVVFNDYDQIYTLITEIGKMAQISKKKSSPFKPLEVVELSPTDKQNARYFYWGMSPFQKDKIISPGFIIERDLVQDVVDNMKKCKLHIVRGNLVSGKTYLLVNVYNRLVDRKRYVFGNDVQINKQDFNKLLNEKNAVVLLDTTAISRDQFEQLLDNAKLINRNQSNFVVCINKNDSERLGLINLKRKNYALNDEDFICYTLNNRFSKRETNSIGSLLPRCKIPKFDSNLTIIDNLFSIEKGMDYPGKLTRGSKLAIKDMKQLACFIALATKNKLYSETCVQLGLSAEMEEIANKYAPFIERDFSEEFERGGGNSPYKYVLNSRIWLIRELGAYADAKRNYSLITKAYEYLITRIKQNSMSDEFVLYNNCKDYIIFDTLNTIFYTNEKHGRLYLVERIYHALYGLLSSNFQYMHQYAKCYLKLGSRKNDKDILKKANRYAQIALSQVKALYNDTGKEKLQITIAHINYTIANIYCEKTDVEKLLDEKEIIKILDKFKEAIYMNYSLDSMSDDSNRTSVSKFIESLLGNELVKRNKQIKREAEQLLRFMITNQI